MSYNNQGIYTPATGATVAAPGQVIASATWNSIHADLSTALTNVGQMNWVNNPRVISSSGNFTITTTDAWVFVKVPAGTITMPLSSSRTYPVKIMGATSSIFSPNTSLIISAGSDTFNGLGTVTLSTANQVATFYPLTSGGYVVSFSG